MVSCLACGLSHNARKNGVTFHRFPKKPEQKDLWLKFINKEVNKISAYAVLCSQHFEDTDFERSAFKVCLKIDAVPSRIIHRLRYAKSCLSSETTLRSDLPDVKHIITTLESPLSPSTTEEIMDVEVPSPKSMSTTIQASVGEDSAQKVKLERQVQTLSRTIIEKGHQVRKLQKQVWSQKKRIIKLTTTMRELENQNSLNSDHDVVESTEEQDVDVDSVFVENSATRLFFKEDDDSDTSSVIKNNPEQTDTKSSQLNQDEYDAIGYNVASKLRHMDKNQRIIAERIVAETLFQGQMGTLTVHSSCSSMYPTLFQNGQDDDIKFDPDSI